MIKEKYLRQIKSLVSETAKNQKIKVFIFGSSIKEKKFGDIDVGISGKIDDTTINKLKESFEDSTLPYFVDVINFNKASKDFKNNVMDQKILWIKR